MQEQHTCKLGTPLHLPTLSQAEDLASVQGQAWRGSPRLWQYKALLSSAGCGHSVRQSPEPASDAALVALDPHDPRWSEQPHALFLPVLIPHRTWLPLSCSAHIFLRWQWCNCSMRMQAQDRTSYCQYYHKHSRPTNYPRPVLRSCATIWPHSQPSLWWTSSRLSPKPMRPH